MAKRLAYAEGVCFLKTPEMLVPQRRVLSVDDDPDLQQTIFQYLSKEGLEVGLAESGDAMWNLLDGLQFDLIILDIRLGREDGLDLLRDIRAKIDIPVIITTGHRLDEIDRVVGLELGADDYVLKPFSLRELLARIRSVLRRQALAHNGPLREASPRASRVRFGGWTLDRRLRRLTNPARDVVSLTKTEFALLSAFVDAPQRPLSREFLLQATRIHEDVYDRSIDVQILRLRRKLEIDPSAPRIIQTERGVGYFFALPVQTDG